MKRLIAHALRGHHWTACRGRARCAETWEQRRIYGKPAPRHAKPPRPPALLTIETIEGSTRRPRKPKHLRAEP